MIYSLRNNVRKLNKITFSKAGFILIYKESKCINSDSGSDSELHYREERENTRVKRSGSITPATLLSKIKVFTCNKSLSINNSFVRLYSFQINLMCSFNALMFKCFGVFNRVIKCIFICISIFNHKCYK